MAKVTLLTYTPQPEKTVAMAAKLCYSPSSIDQIGEGLTEEKTASFVQMLAEIGHESPIEHASFTFGIEGVSRSLLAQITRHRIASFSVQSQRYVAESDFAYVVPPEIEAIPEAKAEFLAAMEEDRRHYERLTALLMEKHRKALLDEGKSEKEAARAAEKRAIEDARFVLPNACETKMVCTFNARSLQNFFALRCCNRAQWEIRDVATQNVVFGAQGCAASLCKRRPWLSARHLPGGEDVLRKGKRSTRILPFGGRRMSGKLITLEGLDGSGKATQTELLCKELAGKGIRVRKISFPDYGQPSSALAKMYLDGKFGENPEDVSAYAASSFYAVDRFASYAQFWKEDYQSGAVIVATVIPPLTSCFRCRSCPGTNGMHSSSGCRITNTTSWGFHNRIARFIWTCPPL